jgi:hypothetical protein
MARSEVPEFFVVEAINCRLRCVTENPFESDKVLDGDKVLEGDKVFEGEELA